MENRIIKILAIDDNQDNLITIQALMQEADPDVIILKALNGKRGLELAALENPDVILLDVVMPEMDGYEVCRKLKNDKNLCDIPVVFITALKGDKDSRIKGLECGAEAFLAKPIDESELKAQVRAMIKIKTAHLERRDENVRLAALIDERTRELKITHTATLNLLEDLKNENAARKKSEESLKESEEKFREMTNLLPQIVFEIDLIGILTYVNKQAFKIYGYEESEEIIGKNTIELFIKEDRIRVVDNIKRRILHKPLVTSEYTMIRKDESTFPVMVYTNHIKKDNKTVGLRGIIVDITEQKLAEERIRHTARLYALLSHINQATVHIKNLQELFQTICEVTIEYGLFNMAWVGMIDKETKIVKPFVYAGNEDGYLQSIVISTESFPSNNGPVARAVLEGQIFTSNDIESDPAMLPWRREAHKRNYKSMSAVPLMRKGTVYATLNFYSSEKSFFSLDELKLLREISDDISFAINAIDSDNQRIITGKALLQSRNEIQTIYDHAPVMMCVIDENRSILFANQAFSNLTGNAVKEIIGCRVGGAVGCMNLNSNLGCGFGMKCHSCKLHNAIEDTFMTGEGNLNIEYQATMKTPGTNNDLYLLGSTAIIFNEDKKNLLLCLHDITDRKLAEEALQRSEMILRTFIDNSPFEIWARDVENVGVLENKKFVDHYGSIIGFTPNSDPRIDSDTAQHWLSINERVLAGDIIDEEYEFDVFNEIHIFQQIVFPIQNESTILGIAGFNIDITDRKKAEEELRSNNLKLEKAMKVANMAWWEMDVKTGNVIFGKQKTEMLGYPPDNFKHKNDFIRLVHPNDYESTMKAMRKLLSGKKDKYETEYRILTSTGDYKWCYDLGNVTKIDADGKPLIISGLVLDITYRKTAEKELVNQKQFFEQMFMQSSLSTQILDKDGWCERINPKLSEIFGVDAKSMEGRVYNIFRDKEIKESDNFQKLMGVFNNGDTTEWEVLFDISEAADSQNITVNEKKKAWYNNWAYPIFDHNGDISHIIIQHNDITDRKLAEDALAKSQEQLKKFASHLQNVREDERVLLAREIHDELGQILIAIKIDLGMLKQNVLRVMDKKHTESVLTKFDILFSLVGNTIKTARKIMTDLRPEVLDLLGFIETIKQHLQVFQERHKINCAFENSLSELILDPQQSVALFRIIQEALNNVAKHSKATSVKVILNLKDGKLTLEIVDNGIGYDENHKKNVDSYGLIGMNERVFLLDGELTIKGKKNLGTSIKVVMPYSAEKISELN